MMDVPASAVMVLPVPGSPLSSIMRPWPVGRVSCACSVFEDGVDLPLPAITSSKSSSDDPWLLTKARMSFLRSAGMTSVERAWSFHAISRTLSIWNSAAM